MFSSLESLAPEFVMKPDWLLMTAAASDMAPTSFGQKSGKISLLGAP